MITPPLWRSRWLAGVWPRLAVVERLRMSAALGFFKKRRRVVLVSGSASGRSRPLHATCAAWS
jgi:hypothetical protein